MSAKFNLLTALTLNATGYNKGLNTAAKSTQQFSKGASEASKTISSSFSGMADSLTSSVGGSMGGVKDAVLGGVGAFRTMIPAINGVKMALISSGIGAIVVAIGLAFAALTSYFTGTAEGSQKLNVILGYLSGTFTAIIKRVHLMGSALVKLFSGDFKGMKKDFEDAFSSGLFKEINEGAKEYAAFAKETNALKNEKLKLDREENELAAKMVIAQTDAKNKNLSIAERAKQQLEYKKLDAELDVKKQSYLKRDWELQEKIVKSKGKSVSYDELELANTKQKAYYDELAKDAQEQVSVNKIDFQLNNAKELAVAKEKSELEEITNSILDSRVKIYNNLLNVTKQLTDEEKFQQSAKNFSKVATGNSDEDYIDDIGIDTEAVAAKINSFNDMLIGLNGIISNTLNDFGTTIGEGLAGLLSNDLDMEGFGKKIFGVFGSFLSMMGKAILAFGIAMEAFQTALKNIFNPVGAGIAILSGIGLIAAGSLITSYANKGVGKYANGGIVGGSSYSGDNVPALVNSREMILNQSQQSRLFAIANGSGSGMSGEVRFEIEGSKLIGVLNNYNRKINRIR